MQYKTLISTRRITHSGTECYHINENARVVNALDIIIIIIIKLQPLDPQDSSYAVVLLVATISHHDSFKKLLQRHDIITVHKIQACA